MGAQYCVGEVLQVKEIDEIIGEFGDYDGYGHIDCVSQGFNRSMEYMCGQTFTVKSVETKRGGYYYRSVEGIENKRNDGARYWFVSDDMLKRFDENIPDVKEDAFFDILLQ